MRRSADFPVRSNFRISPGSEQFAGSPSGQRCCGLESPRSAPPVTDRLHAKRNGPVVTGRALPPALAEVLIARAGHRYAFSKVWRVKWTTSGSADWRGPATFKVLI